MRPTLLIFVALSVVSTHASWFADSPQYTSWSRPELEQWLEEHGINPPPSCDTAQLQDLVKSNWDAFATAVPPWSHEQYTKAQQAFQGLKDSSFDSWDESRLREFLLEQGVVAPSGPREQLVRLAQDKHRGYNAAASSFSTETSQTAGSVMSSASSAASTASTAIAQATKDAMRALDDTKDYVYSTWDESQLRKFLEDKGIVDKKTVGSLSREQLLEHMHNGYASVSEPVWDTWSDSYIREWLLAHDLITPAYDAKRATLVEAMKHYYYSMADTVFSTWSDSQLAAWLVDHGYVKSGQQLDRAKMLALARDNYAAAADTVWGAWSDSDIRAWLIEKGHMRSDAQVRRDELVGMINDKYDGAAARAAAYLVWPDARLRAYLRERGISEQALPTGRPGLLQETRIRWVQTNTRAENLFSKIKELLNSSMQSAEDSVHQILELLTGTAEQARAYADEKADDATDQAAQGKEYVDEKVQEGRGKTGEKVKQAGAKVEGEL